MKKSLFIILMVCLALVGLVSCKNEIESAQEELIYVSFEKGTSRALTATLEDFDVDDYYWSYEAKKNDGSGLKSGQTDWDEDGTGSVAVQTGKGLNYDGTVNPVKVPGFSKGYWNFRLFAYTDADRTKLAYWGEVDSVLIDSSHHLASVTVSPVSGEAGYLKIGTITFVPASGISVPTDLVIYTDEVFKLVNNEWVKVSTEPVEGVYTLPAGQYKFTRTYSFDGIPVANGSVIVTIYSNLTTTVSGSLSELTTYAEFEGKQNPDIVRETWGSDIVTESTAPTATVDFTRNLDTTATNKVKEASMPASAAVAKLAELKEAVGADDNTSSTLKLNLSVDTTDVRQQSVTYDIGMEAVLTYTKNAQQTSAKSDVKNVTDYVLIDIDLTSDITGVTVTHSGEAMILTDDMSKAGKEGETDPKYVDVNKGTEDDPLWVGFYMLETTTNGKVLHLKTKSFSPFEVTYAMTNYVAAIGNVKYTTLTAAIAAAKAGDTIIILDNITTDDGYLIDKTLSINTQGFTITVNKGDNINYRAFKVTSGKLSVYGGGTIDAKGQATESTGTEGTGCYGAFRAEIGTELYLKDITLKNYRPWGLNVKVLGAYAELDKVKIVSVCGGGIEVTDDDGAAGTVLGYAKLTNCEMEQSDYRDWCSAPVCVSGKSTIDVYSTSYTGEYGVYVFSSGGAINIYGGVFASKNGLPVLITTYDSGYGNDAIINVYGGSFSGPFQVGNSGHEFLNITGGAFDHDPSAYVSRGYKVDLVDNMYVVSKRTEGPASIIENGEKLYFASLQDAIDAAFDGETVYLEYDYDAETRVTINGQSITLDGQNHSLSASKESNIENGRTLNVYNETSEDASEVTLRNLVVVGPTSGYSRGVNIADKVNLTIDGCTISAGHYAINVISGSDGTTIDLKSSSVASGWAALNIWSKTDITVVGGTLSGVNDKPFNVEGWNNFATIVYNAGSGSSTISCTGVEIIADTTTSPKNEQALIDIRKDATGVTGSFEGCTFEYTTNDTEFDYEGEKYTSDWMFYATDNTTVVMTDCSFYIDGSEATLDDVSDHMTVYTYEALENCSITINGEVILPISDN